MSYSELLDKLHRTWVQALIDDYWTDYAAMVVDAALTYHLDSDYGEDFIDEISVFLPLSSYSLLEKDEEGKQVLIDKFRFIGQGHIWGNMENFPVNFRVKLIDVEQDWKKTIKYLIAQSKDLNQAVIKDKEKDAWLKKSGILCIEHFTAESCYNTPKAVVAEFLEHLAKYKK
jgi:hypothetical protein